VNDTAAGNGAAGEAGNAGDEDLSYEQARDELTSVVRRLEAGGLTLQESMDLWERGERLAKTCESWLEGARAKLAAALAEDTPGEETNDQDDRPF
jgi:exodeoxyribonuclease VII small subunit